MFELYDSQRRSVQEKALNLPGLIRSKQSEFVFCRNAINYETSFADLVSLKINYSQDKFFVKSDAPIYLYGVKI